VLSAVPRDVTVLEKSPDMILLRWDYDGVAGVTFWVKYRPSTADSPANDDDDDLTWIETEKTTNTDYRLTGLQPATDYCLCVIAQSDAGYTQCSRIISCQTDVTLGTASIFYFKHS